MGLAAGVLAVAVLAAGTAPGQGANLTAYTHDGYAGTAATEALDALRETGMDRVAIVPTWYMDDATDSTVERDPATTPSDASVLKVLQSAHDHGLQTLLKPQVDVLDGTFRGEIAPADAGVWWSSYRAMIEHYADLAQRAGVSALTVGVELRSMSTDAAAFDELIAGVRSRFHGTITYAANWDEAEQVGFWPQLDAIGVDAYYPLATAPGAPVSELMRAWQPVIARLHRLSETARRPLMLTELGYAARPNATIDPSGAGAGEAAFDLEAQRRGYEAALRAWSGVRWLDAIYWWDWPADPRDATGDAYSPRGRPAGALVRQFAVGEHGAQASSVPWALIVLVTIWLAVAAGFLAVLRATETAPVPGGAVNVAGRRAALRRRIGPARRGLAQPWSLVRRVRLPRVRLRRPLDMLRTLLRRTPPVLTPARPSRATVIAAPAAPTRDPAVPHMTAARPPGGRFVRPPQVDPLTALGAIDLDRLAALTCQVLDLAMCGVLVRSPDDPRSLISAGEHGIELRGRRWPADAGVAGLVLARAEAVAVTDYAALGERIGGDQTLGVRTAASAPLIVHRALRGALSAASTDPERVLGRRDLELLGAMAELVAAGLSQPGGDGARDSMRSQIDGLSAAMEARDPGERQRNAALGAMAVRVVERMAPRDPVLRAELAIAARVHDVGMLRVPSAPLRGSGAPSERPGRLVAAHPAWGCDLLGEIPGLQGVAAIVRFHEERWDGSGYPHQLAGHRIPLPSRILAAAEAWATIVVGRPDAPARSPERAVQELRRQSGRDLDPTIVEVLAALSSTVAGSMARQTAS